MLLILLDLSAYAVVLPCVVAVAATVVAALKPSKFSINPLKPLKQWWSSWMYLFWGPSMIQEGYDKVGRNFSPNDDPDVHAADSVARHMANPLKYERLTIDMSSSLRRNISRSSTLLQMPYYHFRLRQSRSVRLRRLSHRLLIRS